MRASLPPNEDQRLLALRGYDVLDTAPERAFDDVALLAAEICQAPSAIITFVDEGRQWFKATSGFELKETHRDLSFCAHTILSPDVLVVPDATQDPRFADNALVTGPPHIRFYAGVPLTSEDGFAVGTVAVLGYEPRQLTDGQRNALRALARQAMAQLELRRRVDSKRQQIVTVESNLQASEERYRRQREAATDLIRDQRLYHGDLPTGLRVITETVAKTLDVARVSVWRHQSADATIHCVDLYELAHDRHSVGAVLRRDDAPAYFDALADTDLVVANDAQHDPRTCDIAESYLVPLGITARLDARIHLNGGLHGVLCHEHVGEAREWNNEDQTFAVAAANLISLAMEGNQRRQAQEALVTQSQILTAVTESLAAYVERGNWKEAFGRLLTGALAQTDSEYGFIGVLVEGPELRVLAHEGIVWDKVIGREFYDEALKHYQEHGYLTFKNLNNLFGRAVTSGEVVVANQVGGPAGKASTPAGHPPLNSFLGVPIRAGGRVNGVVALANRPGGYGDEQRNRIEILVRQAGGICESYRQSEAARVQGEEHRQVEAALRESDDQRKQLEAQLRQSQKMEAVGLLAGGVAHDFNNILTVIQGHASLLLVEPHGESVAQIAEAADRAASLTRQLLAFSRKQVLQSVDLDLNEVVASMMRMLQRILGEHIALQFEPSPHQPFVHADVSMIEQVILNLAVNARDAMTKGGRLTLRTTTEHLSGDAAPDFPEARSGPVVRLRITDTGCGIPAEHLPRIFEPFYTTKDVERGTGLGLATVYGVVTQHHGWISVQSTVGQGTSFDIYLPAVAAPPASVEGQAAGQQVKPGHETILVVEDEEPVRMLARLLLERNGYTVLEAPNGPSALAVWREHQGAIDLVLTDMVMPEGMSGLELANTMLTEAPHAKIIVTSGYSVDLFGKELPFTTGVSFLQKPYQMPQLLQAVRASLDGP